MKDVFNNLFTRFMDGESIDLSDGSFQLSDEAFLGLDYAIKSLVEISDLVDELIKLEGWIDTRSNDYRCDQCNDWVLEPLIAAKCKIQTKIIKFNRRIK